METGPQGLGFFHSRGVETPRSREETVVLTQTSIDLDRRQFTYLKPSNKPTGLLMNFNDVALPKRLKGVVHHLSDPQDSWRPCAPAVK